MIIINADDWGRSSFDTDATLRCHEQKRITSISAMVFMRDSERAAELAKANGMDVGLHLNFTERFTGDTFSPLLREYHNRTRRFLTTTKYAVLLYNPALREQFRYVYQAQTEEFVRLYQQSRRTWMGINICISVPTCCLTELFAAASEFGVVSLSGQVKRAL